MSNEPVIKGAPEVIYLQVCDAEHCEELFSEHEETTWCVDKINDLDIEYIRADLAHPAPDDSALLRQALDCLENHVMQRTYAGGVVIANTAIALRERLGDKA